ncbi:MAG TPA: ATP-binding protein, partial [Ramlibacter sp.]
RWFLGRIVPLDISESGVAHWMGLATDIHERKLMEQDLRATAAALEEADRQKNQFLATLAHELRNPMAPIRYAAALIRPDAKPEVLQKARTTIERQSAHMSRLLDDLLDMSRITRVVIELQRAPVDMVQAVQEVVDNVRPEATAQRHALTLDLGSGPAWVDGDLARLQQVVGNLLSNAIKYTPPGGHIDVRLGAEAEQVVLRVADTGVGLSPEMLPQLFQLFSQLHRGLTVSSGGLGIGLAVSRRLVQLHGGSLRASSAGLGEGSEFTVRLPRAMPPPGSGALPPDADEAFAPPLASRVLVVDDNEDAAVTLADVLTRHGHETRVATSGRKAIELARALVPDVIVLDIGLPDLSGVEVARTLRADPAMSECVIIAVTGWGQEEDRRRTQAVGVDHHLVKPVSPDMLLRSMALGRRR